MTTGTATPARLPPGLDTAHPCLIAYALTAAYVIVGLATGSLALLSDAAHMGTDVGLGMALAAVNPGPGPRSPQCRTWRAPVCDCFST